MACACIEETNKVLAQDNERLDVLHLFNRETGGRRQAIRLSTVLIEKKRGQKPRFMIPNFCPLCGVEYEAPEAES